MIYGLMVDNEAVCPKCRGEASGFENSLVPIRHNSLDRSAGHTSEDEVLCTVCSETIVEVIDDTQPPWEGAERRPIR